MRVSFTNPSVGMMFLLRVTLMISSIFSFNRLIITMFLVLFHCPISSNNGPQVICRISRAEVICQKFWSSIGTRRDWFLRYMFGFAWSVWVFWTSHCNIVIFHRTIYSFQPNRPFCKGFIMDIELVDMARRICDCHLKSTSTDMDI